MISEIFNIINYKYDAKYDIDRFLIQMEFILNINFSDSLKFISIFIVDK